MVLHAHTSYLCAQGSVLCIHHTRNKYYPQQQGMFLLFSVMHVWYSFLLLCIQPGIPANIMVFYLWCSHRPYVFWDKGVDKFALILLNLFHFIFVSFYMYVGIASVWKCLHLIVGARYIVIVYIKCKNELPWLCNCSGLNMYHIYLCIHGYLYECSYKSDKMW